MATYSTAVSAQHATTTAGTADAVTLQYGWPFVQILLDAAAPADAYVTADTGPQGAQTAKVPTVGGTDCYRIQPGGTYTFPCTGYTSPSTNTTDTVRIISSGAVSYSVMGLPRS